jgi:hypothetical protein
MANPVCEVLLTEQPLTAPPHGDLLETGAVVDFWGVVRKTEGSEGIRGIDYEAHAIMAEHQMRALAVAALERFTLTEVVSCTASDLSRSAKHRCSPAWVVDGGLQHSKHASGSLMS